MTSARQCGSCLIRDIVDIVDIVNSQPECVQGNQVRQKLCVRYMCASDAGHAFSKTANVHSSCGLSCNYHLCWYNRCCALQFPHCLRCLFQKKAQKLYRHCLQVTLFQARTTLSTGASIKGSTVTRTCRRRMYQPAVEAERMKILLCLLHIQMARQQQHQQGTIQLMLEVRIEMQTARETRTGISIAQSASISPEMLSLMCLAHKRGSVTGIETHIDTRTEIVAEDIEMTTGVRGTSLPRAETERRTKVADGIGLKMAGMTEADDDCKLSNYISYQLVSITSAFASLTTVPDS